MIFKDVGVIGYAEALRIQEQLVAEVQQGGEEALLLLEHLPVYTIGAGGDRGNVLDPELEPVRVNRGGDVTYHGPGQLVCYPILDLSRRGRDLHRYLRFLERFLVELCAGLGVGCHTVPGRTGVWTGNGKLASIGVGVRRWVSMHGFALNVSPDTAPFSRINPCGMPGCSITSLSLELGEELFVDELKEMVAIRFQPLLNLHLPR
ncbi:octanoyl-(acyl carrier protein)--protein octanoyltransferase [Citrifermentans bemidjiense Bem]|uniref:Octanoyltransferase n=2 Tax=Citrifermentans bemidjiense TaxID=225194 RepID=LIPB_CITBB|nr:RecName: Full=Octanoyltransferase; AltName: Full=Lipoate-protein ligase B; AltName: Full=Lipoyl/octanoyl transferase; AltName: Full=Octanoyl-[acyl-carrier-protein]-protein N-octanoyltransferase [Citrifermentans bemidjiense Bem]ACH37733.1 octanoyl-(acyl carrier protein)--protein octanoyltransferase [Citrifermentans bemidjiense Bem]